MVNLALTVGISLTALVIVVLIYLVALRSRHHYTSVLTCPKCHGTFEYNWVSLVAFTAVRLGSSRYLECPLCHEWSTFNIWDTRKERPAP